MSLKAHSQVNTVTVNDPTKSTNAIMAGEGSSENSRSRPVATPICCSKSVKVMVVRGHE